MTGSLVVPFFRALFAIAVRPRPFLRDNVFNKRECALDALKGGDGERETPRRRGNSDREKRERGGIACYSPKRRYGILYTQAGDSRESEPKGCVSEKLESQLWNGERSRRYVGMRVGWNPASSSELAFPAFRGVPREILREGR